MPTYYRYYYITETHYHMTYTIKTVQNSNPIRALTKLVKQYIQYYN